MVVADSSGLEPVPVPYPLFVQQAQGLVEGSRAEYVGVKDVVEEPGRELGSLGDEAHHDNAFRQARL